MRNPPPGVSTHIVKTIYTNLGHTDCNMGQTRHVHAIRPIANRVDLTLAMHWAIRWIDALFRVYGWCPLM